jgi:hypothetical protein
VIIGAGPLNGCARRAAAADESSHMTLDGVLAKLEAALRDRGVHLPPNISR